MSEMPLSIVILLATGPDSPDMSTVKGIAIAAVRAGHEVSIFLLGDGAGLADHPSIADLAGLGVRTTVCSINVMQREVEEAVNVTLGSLYDLAVMVRECDRFLSFC